MRLLSIIVTALAGISFILYFVLLQNSQNQVENQLQNMSQSQSHNQSQTKLQNQSQNLMTNQTLKKSDMPMEKGRGNYSVVQMDTSALGILSCGPSGLLAGNTRGELRLFPLNKSVNNERNDSHKTVSPIIMTISEYEIAAPVLEKNQTFFMGDENGTFWAVDSKGKKKWSFKTGNRIAGGALFYDNIVIFGSYDCNLYAFDAQTGKQLYNVECNAYINGTPVFSETRQALFLGSCDGILRKIDIKSGKIMARYDMKSPIPSSPVLYEDVIYVLSHEGAIAALKADNLELIYREKTSDSYTSSPFVSKEFLFLTDSLGCIYVHSRQNGKRLATLQPQELSENLENTDSSENTVSSEKSISSENSISSGSFDNKHLIGNKQNDDSKQSTDQEKNKEQKQNPEQQQANRFLNTEKQGTTQQHRVKNPIKMVPLQAEYQDRYYAVSEDGKLFEFKVTKGHWTQTLLTDFKTDFRQSCIQIDKTLYIADDNGSLFYYEVNP